MYRNVVLTMLVLVVCAIMVFGAGCQTKAQTGAAAGAGVGALAGQVIGGSTEGTLIGGAIGAGAGYLIGREMDKKDTRAETEANTVTVNITNSNGSVTPVRLTRQGMNYVGPKGEIYDHLPTEAELKPVYGF